MSNSQHPTNLPQVKEASIWFENWEGRGSWFENWGCHGS